MRKDDELTIEFLKEHIFLFNGGYFKENWVKKGKPRHILGNKGKLGDISEFFPVCIAL